MDPYWLRFLRAPAPLFDAPKDQGTGGDTPTPPAPTAGSSGADRSTIEAVVQEFLGRGADQKTTELVGKLVGKVDALQRERDEARTQLSQLQGRLPDGAVVLTGDDAKTYAALAEAHTPAGGAFSLAALADALKTGTEAHERLTRQEREAALKAAFDLAGARYDVFRRLAGADGLAVELEGAAPAEGEEDQRKPMAVLTQDGKTTKRPLAEYLEEAYPEVKDALFAEARDAADHGRRAEKNGRFLGQASGADRSGAQGKPRPADPDEVKRRQRARLGISRL